MGTLAALITRSRGYIHDKVEPYLWSNDELVGCYSEVLRALTIEFPAIEDRTTAAVCAYAYLADAATIAVHQAIRNIQSARVNGEDNLLTLTTRATMDVEFPDWEDADSATPTHLVISGLGNDIVALYPTPLVAGTLDMVVTRAPLVDAVYATDSAVTTALGIDDIFIAHGIAAMALMFGDRDAEDIEKGERHMKLYKEGKENFHRGMLRKNFLPHGSQPHPGAGT